MPLVPLSFLFSLMCLILLLRLGRPQRQRWAFQLLLLLCIWQSLLIGLRYGYHVALFNPLQPFGAVLVPVLSYLALLTSAQGRLSRYTYGHLMLPLWVWLAATWAPVLLDALIVASYLGYGIAMLFYLRRGENCLQQVALTESWLSYRLWRALAVVLILCSMAEIVIIVDFELFGGRLAALVATVSNTLLALGVALALGLMRPPEATVEPVAEVGGEERAAPEQTAAWFAQIHRRLQQDNLYLTPELNLASLARKVGLPARKVSQAINQQTGMNVSQYVNQLRIQQAAAWLRGSEKPVTEIMLDAGFITKSNFNREFQRVLGMSPSEWRRRQAENRNNNSL
jgi:AraC-like DNA-binding protein